MARIKGSKNKRPKSWQLMEELLARDFDLVDEITNLFATTKDDRIKSDLLKVMIEYIFPKAATTQLLSVKNLTDDAHQMTPKEMLVNWETEVKPVLIKQAEDEAQ